MANLFEINEGNVAKPVEEVHCKNEAEELQDLLEKNPNALLVGEQINPESPRRWFLIKREMPVPNPTTGENHWSIDFFFVDQDGMPTFVECKRFLDTRSRREVVGQMMEYAANGQHYWDKEEIRTYLEQTHKKSGEDLNEVLMNFLGEESISVDELLDKVEGNLQEGQIRLIFYMEKAPYELRSIVEFLNNQMERAEVLIIESRIYQLEGKRIIQPTLFGYTERARQIKRAVTLSRPGRPAKKWDPESLMDKLNELGNKNRAANFKSLLELPGLYPDLFIPKYGSGITGSLGLKNNRGISLMHIYTSGEFYLTAPYYLSQKLDEIIALKQKYEPSLQWQKEFGSQVYIRLTSKLEELNQSQISSLKEFLIELAELAKDLGKENV